MKNFRIVDGELFEADSTDEGDINLYDDYNIAMDCSNSYRKQECKSRVVKNAAGNYVVYFHRKRREMPKITLSRRFRGKDYLPERTIYGSIVMRRRDNAIKKVEYYKEFGYNCKIIDYLIPEDLVIIYMRHVDTETNDPHIVLKDD